MGVMTVIINLNTFGPDVGPIDLYTDSDGYVTPIESGLNISLFVGGYNCSLVPDDATIIRVQSNGVCVNYIDLDINALPLPTPTPSVTAQSTPTPTPPNTPTPSPTNLPVGTYTVYFETVVTQDTSAVKRVEVLVRTTPELAVGDSFKLYYETFARTESPTTLIKTITATSERRFDVGGYVDRSTATIPYGNSGDVSQTTTGNMTIDSTFADESSFFLDSVSAFGNDSITHEVKSKVRIITVEEVTGGGTYEIHPTNYYVENIVNGPFTV